MPASTQATVEDASPSPPPEAGPSTSTQAKPGDQPITSLGGESGDEDDGDVEDEEWDPASERLPGEERKGKRKAEADAVEGEEAGEAGKAHPWQAVWSEEKNAWYFWNTATGEVTWTNPLEPPAGEAAPPLPPGPPPAEEERPRYARPGIPEIDPGLAFLLPPEARGGPSDPSAQSAMFNARTGKFSGGNAYNIDRLDEYNRMKRMSNQYFDYEKWEAEVAADKAKKKRDEEMGVAPKGISKKDMDRFKRKKQEKKLRGQAWLRD